GGAGGRGGGVGGRDRPRALGGRGAGRGEKPAVPGAGGGGPAPRGGGGVRAPPPLLGDRGRTQRQSRHVLRSARTSRASAEVGGSSAPAATRRPRTDAAAKPARPEIGADEPRLSGGRGVERTRRYSRAEDGRRGQASRA